MQMRWFTLQPYVHAFHEQFISEIEFNSSSMYSLDFGRFPLKDITYLKLSHSLEIKSGNLSILLPKKKRTFDDNVRQSASLHLISPWRLIKRSITFSLADGNSGVARYRLVRCLANHFITCQLALYEFSFTSVLHSVCSLDSFSADLIDNRLFPAAQSFS